MGTALVLLFLLALGAIPGALLPQRSLNAGKVDDYLQAHPVIGPWLDRLQAFDVFSSFWFTAIYVLLFVSLVGCLTPRMIEHARSLRATPVAAPRNLARLPKHASRQRPADDPTLNALANTITGTVARLAHHHPAPDDSEPDGSRSTVEVSAEKGYLREFGNLALPLLAAGPAGRGGRRQAVRLRGQRDRHRRRRARASARRRRPRSTRSGPATPSTAPRCTRSASGSTTSRRTTCRRARPPRSPRDIDYQAGDDLTANTWRPYRLEVNHPLRIGGDRVYLQGHGYAPTFTVTFPDGQTRTSTVQWRPDNPQTLLSSGVARIDPPAGSYPDRRRAPQARDRDPGPAGADRAARRRRCCRRASRR